MTDVKERTILVTTNSVKRPDDFLKFLLWEFGSFESFQPPRTETIPNRKNISNHNQGFSNSSIKTSSYDVKT